MSLTNSQNNFQFYNTIVINKMLEDNLESGFQVNYNMENFSTYRRRISHFELYNDLERSHQNLEESLKEDSAKNTLIDIDDTYNTHPLRLRDQKNIVNGWIEHKSHKQQQLKSFRTKTYSKNRKPTTHLINSLQISIEELENHIPKLKNILKKLESPEKNEEFGNFKQNVIYSQKRNLHEPQNNTIIPYKFESVFHTIATRQGSRQKRKKIINFSDYRQNNKKQHHLDETSDELKKIKNILIIKQAGKKGSFRR